jgi:hypothetical protein
VIIIPHGDAQTVSNGSPAALVDSAASLGRFLAGDLRAMRLGGGGATTRFVCGYFGCEREAERLFLAGLPQVIRINVRGDATGEWLESCIRYLVDDADGTQPGQGVLLSKMAEALFVQTLRRYIKACRRSSPAGSASLASRRLRISRDGACSSRRGCCGGAARGLARSQPKSATHRRRHSIVRSDRSSRCRRFSIGATPAVELSVHPIPRPSTEAA